MANLAETLRIGSWLTLERVQLVVLALLIASVIGAASLVGTSNGINDRLGRPLGTAQSLRLRHSCAGGQRHRALRSA